MKYKFHPEALEDYADSAAFYAEISAELSKAYIESIEKGIEQILENPQVWGFVEEDVQRHLIKRFPFGIYYTSEPDYILIVAVMHMSRKPNYWKSRLAESQVTGKPF